MFATIASADYDLANIIATTTPSSVGSYNTQSVNVTGTTATALFKDGGFFFIPVDNGNGTATDDVKVEIAYDIVTLDTNLDGNHSKAPNKVVVPLPTGTLKKGAAYNFNFTVSMTEIKVDVTKVNDWNPTAGTDTPVTLP